MKKLLLFTGLLLMLSYSYAQWVEQATGFATASRGITDISIVDANTVWAIAYDGSGSSATVQEFTKTTDGGTTWTPGTIDVGNTTLGIAMIHAYDADTAWVVAFINSSGQQGVFITKDGGSTWTRQTTASYTGSSSFSNVVYFWDGLNGFCMGDPESGYFEIYTTADGGNLWTRVITDSIAAPLSGEYGYTGQYTVAANSAWFTTNKGRLYHSTNNGASWDAYQSPISDFGGSSMSGNIAFKDDNYGILINNFNNVWSTSDAGQTWNIVTTTGPVYAAGLCFVEGTDFVVSTGSASTAAGSSYSFDGGTTWVEIDTMVQHLDVAFLDETTGWSGGFNTDATTGGMFKYSGVLTSVFNQIQENPELAIYPNPSKDIVNIISDKAGQDLIIYDITGKAVYHATTNSKNTIIDVSNFNKGIYTVSINSSNKKLIVY